MKRIIIPLCVMLLMLVLASCTGNNNQEQTTQGMAPQEQAEEVVTTPESSADTASDVTAGESTSNGETELNMEQTGYTIPVPADYTKASDKPGTVIRLDYDSKDYVRDESPITKTAYV